MQGAFYFPERSKKCQTNAAGAGSGIMESEETRVEWTKGEHGYFTGSKPGGGKGHGSSGKSGKTPALHKGGGTASGSPAVDSEGKPYSYPTLRLPKKEYGRVMSEINTHYHTRFEGKSIGRILLSQNVYYFEIHGFSEYNIYGKFKNE